MLLKISAASGRSDDRLRQFCSKKVTDKKAHTQKLYHAKISQRNGWLVRV